MIPAEYGFVAKQVVVRPSERRVSYTPPVYRTVARQVLVQEERSGWRRVAIGGYCG